MTTLAQAIGRVLRRERAALGITLEVAAKAAGVSIGFLSAVERGLNSPSLPVLSRMCRAVGSSLADVVRDAERLVTPDVDVLSLERAWCV